MIAIQPLPLVKFLWSLLFIALSNYSFIKRNFPSLKNAYIAVVIPPFLMGCSRRIQAAVFSFIAGVMPPMPMLGRSLL